jgi:hypothetical protein
MSGPPNGKYWIRLAVGSKPSIGVDDGPAPVKPVITEGINNIWTVRKLEDGNYNLTLEDAGRLLFIQDDGGKLVGSDTPPPFSWAIRSLGQDSVSYTIEVPSGIWPSRGWTVLDPEPRSPVIIGIIEVPLPNQTWNFIRWPGPE